MKPNIPKNFKLNHRIQSYINKKDAHRNRDESLPKYIFIYLIELFY
jgi:hypothetical protein